MNVVMVSYLGKQTPKLQTYMNCRAYEELCLSRDGVNVSPNLIDIACQTMTRHWVAVTELYTDRNYVCLCFVWLCFFGCVFITLYLILHLGWGMNQMDIWVDVCLRNQFRWSTKPNLYQFLTNSWLFCKNHENLVAANIGIHQYIIQVKMRAHSWK